MTRIMVQPCCLNYPTQRSERPMCKHTRVQIVAREDDVEFVECVECGEIFEASEFRVMAIEDKTAAEES